jgi:hypothetical protein
MEFTLDKVQVEIDECFELGPAQRASVLLAINNWMRSGPYGMVDRFFDGVQLSLNEVAVRLVTMDGIRDNTLPRRIDILCKGVTFCSTDSNFDVADIRNASFTTADGKHLILHKRAHVQSVSFAISLPCTTEQQQQQQQQQQQFSPITELPMLVTARYKRNLSNSVIECAEFNLSFPDIQMAFTEQQWTYTVSLVRGILTTLSKKIFASQEDESALPTATTTSSDAATCTSSASAIEGESSVEMSRSSDSWPSNAAPPISTGDWAASYSSRTVCRAAILMPFDIRQMQATL